MAYSKQQIEHYKALFMDKIIDEHESMMRAIEKGDSSRIEELATLIKFHTEQYRVWDREISEEDEAWNENNYKTHKR